MGLDNAGMCGDHSCSFALCMTASMIRRSLSFSPSIHVSTRLRMELLAALLSPHCFSICTFKCPVQCSLNDRQIFFGTNLHFLTDALALFVFAPGKRLIKILSDGQCKDMDKLYDKGQAWYFVVIFDIGKIELRDIQHFRNF